MMLVTGIYLAFEVAFGARLLDVVSTTLDEAELHQIEVAGRIISGFALTLVVWSAFLLPAFRRRGIRNPLIRGPLLALSCALCCGFSYVLQEAILDGISRSSSAAERRAATTLTLVATSVQNSDVTLTGIDFEAVGRSAPETKTFMALLPALALKVKDLEERTSKEVRELLTRAAAKELGYEHGFLNDIYLPSEAVMKQLYNGYIDASDAYNEGAKAVRDSVQPKYRAYRNGLGRYTPQTLPRNQWNRVRNDVNRRLQLMLPPDWDPRDEKGFRDNALRTGMSRVSKPYEDQMNRMFGEVLPSDLGFESFFAHPVVQKTWRDKIGLIYPVKLDVDLSHDAAVQRIYQPWVNAVVEETIPLYLAPIEDFEIDGSRYEEGVTSMRIAYIPLIAFSFSIFGALVHTFKTANFAAQAAIGFAGGQNVKVLKWCKKGILAATIAMGVIISQMPNPVTRSELFLQLEQQTRSEAGILLSTPMRVVLQMQPYLYPIADDIRHVLGGITFDFDPETETPAFDRIDI